jgi:hypothetical protein
MVRALRFALGIKSVRGEAKTVTGGIAFAAASIELDEAGGSSQEQDEDASGKWIKRAKMADLTESRKMTDRVHNVV